MAKPPAQLKTLLKHAYNGPVSVAFALGGDGKAIVKLDRIIKPRALAKALKTADPKSKNIRSGTVQIDGKLAKFTMDKGVSGFKGKLIVALKGTGINKVDIGK